VALTASMRWSSGLLGGPGGDRCGYIYGDRGYGLLLSDCSMILRQYWTTDSLIPCLWRPLTIPPIRLEYPPDPSGDGRDVVRGWEGVVNELLELPLLVGVSCGSYTIAGNMVMLTWPEVGVGPGDGVGADDSVLRNHRRKNENTPTHINWSLEYSSPVSGRVTGGVRGCGLPSDRTVNISWDVDPSSSLSGTTWGQRLSRRWYMYTGIAWCTCFLAALPNRVSPEVEVVKVLFPALPNQTPSWAFSASNRSSGTLSRALPWEHSAWRQVRDARSRSSSVPGPVSHLMEVRGQLLGVQGGYLTIVGASCESLESWALEPARSTGR